MSAKEQAFRPSVTDAAVKAATGRDWAGWFAVLDKANAARLGHKEIALLLQQKHKVPGWWAQMVTVNFERARGLRAVHQKAGGQFSVSVSKTMQTDVSTLYEAVSDAAMRRKWFPSGTLKISSQTTDKYLRGAWKHDTRLEFGFLPKGAGKAQFVVQVNKINDHATVETERVLWKRALTKLANILEA